MIKRSGKIIFASVTMIIITLVFYSVPSTNTDEEITIDSGGSKISGILRTPRQDPKGYIILAHGNRREGKNHPLYQNLAKRLGSDYVVLAIDFTGFGKSNKPKGNRFETLDFSNDLIASVQYLGSRFKIPREDVILIGHSLGSVQVLNAGGLLHSRIIIPIGAGDADRLWLTSLDRKRRYADKIKAETDVEIDTVSLEKEFDALRLERIFSRYKFQNVIFIYGEYEADFIKDVEKYINCTRQKEIFSSAPRIVIIPKSNHMYRTETKRFTEKTINKLGLNSAIEDIVKAIRKEISRVETKEGEGRDSDEYLGRTDGQAERYLIHEEMVEQKVIVGL